MVTLSDRVHAEFMQRTNGPGWQRLKANPKAEAIRLRTLADQRKALAAARNRIAKGRNK